MDIDVKSLENYYFCCFYFKINSIKFYEYFLLDEETNPRGYLHFCANILLTYISEKLILLFSQP